MQSATPTGKSSVSSFSPLFVGAGVAISPSLVSPGRGVVSVPYLSGQALQSAGGGVESVSVTVSVPYLSGQALQLDSTLCPNFVSTFCQGARQPTA